MQLRASLWSGIEAGQWVGMARRDDEGTAVVRLARTSAGGATSREIVAARGVIEGAALKEIAFAIGVTTSTAARYVSRALQRLAVTTRGELVALAAVARDVAVDHSHEIEIRIAPQKARPEAPLTPAERDVIDAVLAGCSVSAIAKRRGVSPRTVVQQTGTAYGKLGVRSRAELVACWRAVA